MKLSYTTLACPQWDIAKILDAAIASRYDAIDFRGYLGVTELPDSPAFQGDALRELAARVRDSGLAVSCLSSGARMSAPTPAARAKSLDAIRRYVDLCDAFGCGMVRIFGGPIDGIADPVANAAETLLAANEIAAPANVRIAVETHDSWTASAMLRGALVAAGWPSHVGFLWDTHHPFRVHGEDPAVSARNLRERLWNTHWKDSYPLPGAPGAHQLCLPGEGDVPFAAIWKALQAVGYDGWITLEWEKKWHPELAEPEIAIPAFASYIRKIAALSSGVPAPRPSAAAMPPSS